MPETPQLPDHLRDAPSVQFNPPPTHYMDQTLGVIGAAVARLDPNEKGKLVWIAHKKDGKVSVNAAVVNKFNDNFEVVLWVGKTWGRPIEAGVAASLSWGD